MKTELIRAALALCVGATMSAFAAQPGPTAQPGPGQATQPGPGHPMKPGHAPGPMTRQAYEAAKAKIASGLRSDQKLCASVKGQARELCEVEAKGKQKALQAELEAEYKPSPEASFKAKNVTADANYEVARKKCDAAKGDAKDRCVKEAKAAREAAVRQAKVEKVEETGGAFRGAKARTPAKDS